MKASTSTTAGMAASSKTRLLELEAKLAEAASTAARRRSIAIPSEADRFESVSIRKETALNKRNGSVEKKKTINNNSGSNTDSRGTSTSSSSRHYLVQQAESKKAITMMSSPTTTTTTTTANAAPAASPSQQRKQQRALQVSHSNSAAEKDGDDSDGDLSGILYAPPTSSPTSSPTTTPTLFPSKTPTGHPTLGGQVFMLRGVVWYDRNANGSRDSNVNVAGLGTDVEYGYGLGGVRVFLKECDEETGREYAPTINDADRANVQITMTAGVGINGAPQLVSTNDLNGKFNIKIDRLERYYYIQAIAPPGYLLTHGVCDDSSNASGKWACDYDTILDSMAPVSGRKLLQRRANRVLQVNNEVIATTANLGDLYGGGDAGLASGFGGGNAGLASGFGLQTGRSTKCVYVDKSGKVQAPLNFGVMKEGDTQMVVAGVGLVLDFDEDASAITRLLKNAKLLDEEVREDGTSAKRYLLAEDEKRNIGTVTAEVLAGILDTRLAKEGIELDSVKPKDVILSESGLNSQDSSTGQLAVVMEIKGHYSPPPNIDFDYIVEDSINTDAAEIRRGLQEYNENCRSQTSKVNEGGMKESDFNAVVSNNGAARPGRGGGRPVADISSLTNVYSTACSAGSGLPDYFETSLKEIEARSVGDVKFKEVGSVTYLAEESRGLESWAMGPIAGIAGLIVLLAGAFVFRRALGPRRVDKYSDGKKTKDLDESEMRRFGEAGGDMDDGSVDSAFYSDSDSDMEETEKERKMRRKRKEKDEEQRGNKGSKGRDNRKKGNSSKNSKRREESTRKFAVSQGSDDTASLGTSDDQILAEKTSSREKKRSSSGKDKERTSKKSSSKRSGNNGGERDRDSERRNRRGRNKKSGGDNSRIV